MRISIFRFLLFFNIFFVTTLDFRFCMPGEFAEAEEAAVQSLEEGVEKGLGEAGEEAAEAEGKIADIAQQAEEALPKEVIENPQALQEATQTIEENIEGTLEAGAKEAGSIAKELEEITPEKIETLETTVAGESESGVEQSLEDAGLSDEEARVEAREYAEGQEAAKDLGEHGAETPEDLQPKDSNSAASSDPIDEEYDEFVKRNFSQDGELEEPTEDVEGKSEEDLEKNAEAKEKTKLEKVKDFFKSAGHFISEQAAMILFMTAPQMMQQAIEEELSRKAALRTVASPVKFGNMVLQVLEQCIDEESPLQSVPLYVTIPVQDLGDSIDPTISKALNSTIAGSQNIGYGEVKVLGIGGTDAATRYNSSDPAYLEYAHFVMSYPSQSYDKIGASLLSDPSFSGMVVDLNAGYAIDATGEEVTAPPSPSLIDMKVNGPQYQGSPISSISSACANILTKLETAGISSTFSTFSGINSGPGEAASLADYFDCSEKNGASLAKGAKAAQEKVSADERTIASAVGAAAQQSAEADLSAAQAALAATPQCLVGRALDTYAAGCSFGSYGMVLPLQGWGTTGYDEIINQHTFPNFVEKDSEVITTFNNPTSGKNSSSVEQQFADPHGNYAAQGCWVYRCSGTPFAKAVQGGSILNSSVNGPFIDYVIFLDENGNVVPLQTPVETPIVDMFGASSGSSAIDVQKGGKGAGAKKSESSASHIKWPAIGLNPKALYMVSLISSSMPEFYVKNPTSGEMGPVAYTKEGGYADVPGLAGIVQQAISTTFGSPGAPPFAQGTSNLYAQFDLHSKALIQKYHEGPFKYGNAQLVEADEYTLKDDNGDVLIRLYQGTNCYGTSGSKAVKDILIARVSSGNITGLPNDQAVEFTSFVTDISYTVGADGSLVASDATAFKYVPGSVEKGVLTLDASKKSDPVVMLPWISSMYKNAGHAISDADYKKLLTYVTGQRNEWFDNFEDHALSQGVTVGEVHFKLASDLDAAVAERNHFYATEASIASFSPVDWFVAVDDKQPSLATLKIVNPADGKAVVSLVTGMVYSMNGLPLVLDGSGTVRENSGDVAGHAVILAVGSTSSAEASTVGQDMFNYLAAAYRSVFVGKDGKNSPFAQAYSEAVAHYATIVNRVMPVGSFGSLNLGIYAGDFTTDTFVYFSTTGLTNSAYFEPRDVFVTVRPGENSTVMGELFSEGTTQYVMSLISGQVYSASGPKFSMPMKDVVQYAGSQSVYWRPTLKNLLAQLQKSYLARRAAQQKEKDLLEAKKQTNTKIAWTKDEVVTLVARLKNAAFLPAPYAMLKQDPISRAYVQLAPGSFKDATDYTYMFFDVPNTYTAVDPQTKKGVSIKVGAVFSSKGECLQVVKGNLRLALMDQYGITDDGQGLGVPMMQPSLLMDDADKNIRPGSNGKSMIVSSSSDFPGGQPISMPSGYYLYYSKNMNSYYVLDVAGKQWIGLGAGHVYAMNGQPIALSQKVAVNKSQKNKVDIVLLEENKAGYMQGFMRDHFRNNVYRSWTNSGDGVWRDDEGNKVSVVDKKGENNNVVGYEMSYPAIGKGKAFKVAYTIDATYSWHNVMYLPITENGDVVAAADMPEQALRSAKVVMQKGEIIYFVLHDVLYKAILLDSNTYKLISLDDPKDIKTLALEFDEKTKVPYFELFDGGSSQGAHADLYGYVYDKLDDDTFNALMADTVSGAITVCPTTFAVGPVNSTTGNPASRTYSLFIPNMSNPNGMTAVDPHNVIGVPSTASSSFQTFSETFSNRVFKSSSGRYFAQLYTASDSPTYPPYFPYFNQDGFVDLQTAALFDQYGNAMGVSLKLDDWLSLLNTLGVNVNLTPKKIDKATGKVTQWGPPGLFYRSARSIEIGEEQAGVSPKASRVKNIKSSNAKVS